MISEWFAESANHTCAPPSTQIQDVDKKSACAIIWTQTIQAAMAAAAVS